MNSEQHFQQVQVAFDAALQREPVERGPYVNQACAGDPSLQAEVEELLAHDAQATIEDFLRTPVLVGVSEDAADVGRTVESVVRYHLEGFHAKGGLGEVYAGWDEQLHRPLALKRIKAHYADDPESLRRFLAEAEVTARLEHPGIVPVHGLAHSSEGRAYYAMRFIEGETFKDAVRRFHQADKADRRLGERSLEFRQLLSRFIAVCNTMAYAHSQGILHRDLKPANIMLGKYGETLVVDWGLAKSLRQDMEVLVEGKETLVPRSETAPESTKPGQVMGTLPFMSPEQAADRRDQVGPASDIYSLGATLYHLLTGHAPFEGQDNEEILERLQRGDLVPPRQVKKATPAALNALCQKAMALKPEDRYETALALAADVEHWLADEPVKAYPEPVVQRLGRWGRRHRTAVASAAVLLLTVVAALAVGLVVVNAERQRTERERERAETNFQLANQAVERMLSRVGLKQLVHVPHMEKVRRELLEDALEFNLTFLRENSTDQKLRWQAAKAYHQVGIIREGLGQMGEAEAAYRQAIRRFDQLVQDFPDHIDHQKDFISAWHNLVIVLIRTHRHADAEAAVLQEQALVQRLAERLQDELECQRLRAGICHIQAFRLTEAKNYAEAEPHCREAIALDEQLAEKAAERGQHLQRRSSAYSMLGTILRHTSRPREAKEAFTQAIRLQEKLVATRPADAPISVELGTYHRNLGNLFQEEGQAQDALEAYQRGAVVFWKLVSDFPSIPLYHSELGSALQGLGKVQRRLGQSSEARKNLEEAVRQQQTALEPDPQNPRYRSLLRDHFFHLADLLVDKGDYNEGAKAAFELARLANRSMDLHKAARFLAGCASLAQKDQTLPESRGRELAQGYAQKGHDLLQEAIKRGYKAEMDPLESPDGFRRLQGDLEKLASTQSK